MPPLIVLQNKVFSPDGEVDIDPSVVEVVNKRNASDELKRLMTGPNMIFAYVTHPQKDRDERPGNSHWGDPEYNWKITSEFGDVIAQGATVWVGPRAYTGFCGGYRKGTYRRPVRATIFSFEYHGWYFESSGSYCRLRRNKRSL